MQYHIERNISLASYTTFKTGGQAEMLCTSENENDTVGILRCAGEAGLSVSIMGRGSNILVSDFGVKGLVLKLNSKLDSVEWDDGYVIAPAGVLLAELARESVKRGFTGLEWAAGIPGTIGGAVAMNAGAYGGEIKNSLTEVRFYEDGNVYEKEVKADDLGYRISAFAMPKRITLAAKFKLNKGVGNEKKYMDELLRQRKEKQPIEYPSAGSTFKRPKGYFAGKLIEEAGLKGLRVGGAMVSEKHAGFIINVDSATSKDIFTLSELVIEKVFENSGIRLEREIKLWGDFTD